MADIWEDVPGEEHWEDVEKPDTFKDVGKGAVRGLAEGTADIPGAPGNMLDLAKRGRDYLHAKTDTIFENLGLIPRGTGELYKSSGMQGSQSPLPTGEDLLKSSGIEPLLPRPETEAGKITERVSRFLPGAVGNPANGARAAASNLFKFGAVPGLLSEGAGQATDALAPGYGDAARLVTGLLTPAAMGGMKTGERRSENVDTAREAGIPVTAGEQTGSEGLRHLEEKLGVGNREEKLGQLTNWATGLIDNGQHATPELRQNTLDRILEDVGGRFDASQRNLTLQHDQQLENELLAQSHDITTPGNHEPGTKEAFNDFFKRYSDLEQHYGGAIPGHEYQDLRSSIARRARNAGDNNDLAETLHALNNSLDNAAERSVQAAGGDPTQFARNRADYRKVLTIEGALKRGNAENRNGVITPEALESSAKQVYGPRQYLRGNTPFGHVPSAVAGLMPKLPQSGTEPRQFARHLVGGLGALAGYGLAGAGGEHGVHGLLLGEALAPALGYGAGYMVGNPAMRIAQPFLRGDFNPPAASDVRSVPGLLSANAAIEEYRRRHEDR